MGGIRLALAVSLALAACGAERTVQGLGGACLKTGDCRADLICIGDDPGGQCTKFCSHDSECGDGNLCNDEGKCYQACHVGSDCPRATVDPRYGCVGTEPRRVCDVAEDPDAGALD